jgi:hypothetical protein
MSALGQNERAIHFVSTAGLPQYADRQPTLGASESAISGPLQGSRDRWRAPTNYASLRGAGMAESRSFQSVSERRWNEREVPQFASSAFNAEGRGLIIAMPQQRSSRSRDMSSRFRVLLRVMRTAILLSKTRSHANVR